MPRFGACVRALREGTRARRGRVVPACVRACVRRVAGGGVEAKSGTTAAVHGSRDRARAAQYYTVPVLARAPLPPLPPPPPRYAPPRSDRFPPSAVTVEPGRPPPGRVRMCVRAHRVYCASTCVCTRRSSLCVATCECAFVGFIISPVAVAAVVLVSSLPPLSFSRRLSRFALHYLLWSVFIIFFF